MDNDCIVQKDTIIKYFDNNFKHLIKNELSLF